jgi:DNA primase
MECIMVRSANGAHRIDTEALKRGRPLADVVASYGIALRRESAGTYRALCPFHQEHTPSFWVDARDVSNMHYFCFGCQETGDVITFVMAQEGCSFTEACERLDTRGRPPSLEPSPRASPTPVGRQWEQLAADSAEANLMERALRLYQEQLWESRRAQDYLRLRGVSEEVARAQCLGYADGHSLLHWLQQSSTDSELLRLAVALGLVLERPRAEDDELVYREFFVDRLIVPELRGGRPIWCIGRAIEAPPVVDVAHPLAAPDSAIAPPAGRPRPKYLGLPGAKPVMGLEHVVHRRAAYLVEGPFDLLAAIGWRMPAFAICGTHFPVERLPAFAEALAIYGVFDPDRAGHSAAERFASLFGSRWRPVWLPNGLDLAELAALGADGRETFDILVGRARAAAWHQGRV